MEVSSGVCYATEMHPCWRQDEETLLFLPQFNHAPCQTVLFTFSRQINLLCQELKSTGVCYSIFWMSQQVKTEASSAARSFPDEGVLGRAGRACMVALHFM